ncbi:flavin reductase family protein [bacterium]|nr:flavin reductase family protein [bacterium]MCB2178966.1 flavin reductase family protein [bacterium]
MDTKAVSNALTLIPYGFYAVTSRDGDDRNVMVLNWLTQVSFEPQHIVIGLQNTSYTMGLIKKSGKFGINIFDQEDANVIKQFTKSREKNPEKFSSANYADGPVTGVPVLDEAAAYLECELVEIVDTGSGHSAVIGKVVGGGVAKDMEVSETLTMPKLGWSYAG